MRATSLFVFDEYKESMLQNGERMVFERLEGRAFDACEGFGSMIRDLDMLFRLHEETAGSASADQGSCVSAQGNFVSERALANCEFCSDRHEYESLRHAMYSLSSWCSAGSSDWKTQNRRFRRARG